MRAAAIAALAVVTACGLGCRKPPELDLARPTRGEIREGFSEPARTRLDGSGADGIRVVSMPVTARVGRIALEPGDPVTVGQQLAEIDEVPLVLAERDAEALVRELSDGRDELEKAIAQAELEEAEARRNDLDKGGRPEEVAMADAAVKAARAELSMAEAERTRAAQEYARLADLMARKVASQQAYETAKAAHDSAVASFTAAEERLNRATSQGAMVALKARPDLIAAADAQCKRARHRVALAQASPRPEQLKRAEVALARARHELTLARTMLRSPIAGTVLARHHRGEALVAGGTPLLELGDLSRLDIVAEVLTEDAMRLEVGMGVELVADAASGGVAAETHAGVVRRIEPAAFTKLSTLGVEEQRVRVAIRFDPAPPPGLGVGFRLQARFTTRRKDDAMLVPRFSVLERPDGRRVILVIDNGTLAERAITTGLESERTVEVVSGLAADQDFVATPSSDLVLGSAVSGRRLDR